MDNSKLNSNIFSNLTRQSISRDHLTTVPCITSLSSATFTTAGTVHHLAQSSKRTELQKSDNHRPRFTSDSHKSIQPLVLSRSLSLEEATYNPPPLKKSRLDESTFAFNEQHYANLYISEMEDSRQEATRVYQDSLSELFYLETNCDILDFNGWNRRPNPELACYIQSRKLEDLMCIEGAHESQNDEIKVFVSSPGSQPIITPIAISKTLPPAVSALQKLDHRSIKVPKNSFSGLSPISPNKSLSFSFSPSKMNLSPEISARDNINARRSENIIGSGDAQTSKFFDLIGDQSINKKDTHIKSSYKNVVDFNFKSTTNIEDEKKLTNSTLERNGDMLSHDAVIELAKHEAKVVQRIAELRKQGLWSQRRLPKVEESSRRLSHWDLLLEEMRWMAVDFFQERRWKMAASCKMAKNAVTFCEEKKDKGWRPIGEIYQKVGARKCAKIITNFWKDAIMDLLKCKQISIEIENFSYLNHIYETELNIDKYSLNKYSNYKFDGEDDTFSENGDYLEEVTQLLAESTIPLTDLIPNYASLIHAKSSDQKRFDYSSMEEFLSLANSLQDVKLSDSLDLSLFKGILRSYQTWDLNLLLSMNRHNVCPIICYDNKLKVEMLISAFLCCLATAEGNWGIHIIMCKRVRGYSWKILLDEVLPAFKTSLLYTMDSNHVLSENNILIIPYEEFQNFVFDLKDLNISNLVLDDVSEYCNMRLCMAVGLLRIDNSMILMRSNYEMNSLVDLHLYLTNRNSTLRSFDKSKWNEVLNACLVKRNLTESLSELPKIIFNNIACVLKKHQMGFYLSFSEDLSIGTTSQNSNKDLLKLCTYTPTFNSMQYEGYNIEYACGSYFLKECIDYFVPISVYQCLNTLYIECILSKMRLVIDKFYDSYRIFKFLFKPINHLIINNATVNFVELLNLIINYPKEYLNFLLGRFNISSFGVRAVGPKMLISRGEPKLIFFKEFLFSNNFISHFPLMLTPSLNNGKLEAIFHILNNCNDKLVVLSSYSTFLDILSWQLDKKFIKYLRVYSESGTDLRCKTINKFNNSKRIQILIIECISLPHYDLIDSSIMLQLILGCIPKTSRLIFCDMGVFDKENYNFSKALVSCISEEDNLNLYRLYACETIEEKLFMEINDKDILFLNETKSENNSCSMEENFSIEMYSYENFQFSDIKLYALKTLNSNPDIFILPLHSDKINQGQKRKLSDMMSSDDLDDVRDDDIILDDVMLTYYMDYNEPENFISDLTGEKMPVWAPPTPPHEDGDIYIDYSIRMLYEITPMTESQLPPIHLKKHKKKTRIDSSVIQRLKQLKESTSRDQTMPPRPSHHSIFDRATTTSMTFDKDGRPVKVMTKSQIMPQSINRSVDEAADQPEWLIHEDWALLQAYNLQIKNISSENATNIQYTINWELVADVVNVCSRVYRSNKQCRLRYEMVVQPRESGAAFKRSQKTVLKLPKTSKDLRTGQLYAQDNGRSISTFFGLKFDSVAKLTSRRSVRRTVNPPQNLSTSANLGAKSTKQVSHMAEFGINFEQPISAAQLAVARAERVLKEQRAKLKSHESTNGTKEGASTSVVSQQLRMPVHGNLGSFILSPPNNQQMVLNSAMAQQLLVSSGNNVILPSNNFNLQQQHLSNIITNTPISLQQKLQLPNSVFPVRSLAMIVNQSNINSDGSPQMTGIMINNQSAASFTAAINKTQNTNQLMRQLKNQIVNASSTASININVTQAKQGNVMQPNSNRLALRGTIQRTPRIITSAIQQSAGSFSVINTGALVTKVGAVSGSPLAVTMPFPQRSTQLLLRQRQQQLSTTAPNRTTIISQQLASQQNKQMDQIQLQTVSVTGINNFIRAGTVSSTALSAINLAKIVSSVPQSLRQFQVQKRSIITTLPQPRTSSIPPVIFQPQQTSTRLVMQQPRSSQQLGLVNQLANQRSFSSANLGSTQLTLSQVSSLLQPIKQSASSSAGTAMLNQLAGSAGSVRLYTSTVPSVFTKQIISPQKGMQQITVRQPGNLQISVATGQQPQIINSARSGAPVILSQGVYAPGIHQAVQEAIAEAARKPQSTGP